jgi:NDP-sugar pyrophosphorylase family protein
MASHTSGEFEGIILAAGRGTRMAPFSERYPKPLLPVANKPLIHHQIEYLRSLGVTRVFIVIGHLGHEIALDVRRGEALGVRVEYVEQERAHGIAHALMQVEARITRPFVLILGDIYFEVDERTNPLTSMQAEGAAGFLAVMRESDPRLLQRNFAVHMDDTGRVRRVIEKPRFPNSPWKGCGIYAFDVSFFDAVRRTPRSAGRDEFELTSAVQIFIEDGAPVIARPLVQCDINLTFPYDLLQANLRRLRGADSRGLIAPDAEIHPGARLSRCIVGPGARIATPVSLQNTLLFPGARVDVTEPIDRAVITGEQIVDCRYWINDDGLPSASGARTNGHAEKPAAPSPAPLAAMRGAVTWSGR